MSPIRSLLSAAALGVVLAAAGVAAAQSDPAAAPEAAPATEVAVEVPAETPADAPVETPAPVEATIDTAAEAKTPIGTGAGSSHIYAAPADKAQMVFFRKSGLLGAAISAHVKDGGVEIGHLPNGRFFVVLVEPGKHTFTVKTEATDTLEMEVEAGETYFVEESVGMGAIVYRLNLSPSDMAAFDKAYPKLKLAKPMKPKKS